MAKKAVKKALISMGVSKDARRATYEYIYRQEKGLPWDNRTAYGVGLHYEQQLYRKGITK